MIFAGRIETIKLQEYFCNKTALLTRGLVMPFATNAQGYSTTGAIT